MEECWNSRHRGQHRGNWAWNRTTAKLSLFVDFRRARDARPRHSDRLGVLHDPLAILLLQGVGDLHSSALRCPAFWSELHLRLGLVSLNGNIGDVHVHSVEIQCFQGCEVLIDAGADGIGVALLFFAAGREDKKPNNSQKGVVRFTRFSSSLPIPHSSHDDNVKDRRAGGRYICNWM